MSVTRFFGDNIRMVTPSPNISRVSADEDACGVINAAFRLNLVYWVVMFFADSLLGYAIHIDPVESAPLKFILFPFSALMTYGMARLLIHYRHLNFLLKALLSLLMTAIAAPIFMGLDFFSYNICQYPTVVKFDPMYSGYILIEGASMIFGWNCLFVAVIDNFEVLERERQLAALREVALTTKMEALRYQVNPHFLFNTLNSIAGLIEEGASTRAGGMVLSLANFMRTTLAIDPMKDVTLAEEIRLQEEYLLIERERFLDRLSFSIELPTELASVLVPSLILQPLIENAIKHGVGKTTGPVVISVSVRRDADRIIMIVENDVPLRKNPDSPTLGMGVGLKNVAERLQMRFGGNSQFFSGFTQPGRFRATINLPWRVE